MRRFLGVVFVLLFAAFSPAVAQEVCVICTTPDAVYRCTIEKSERVKGLKHAERMIRYGCVSVLAKTGGHGSCRAGNGGPQVCNGKPVTVGASQLLAIPPPNIPNNNPAPGGFQTQPPARNAASGEPRTMEELAQKSYQDTKDGLKKAGKTVTDTAKTTGKVVTDTAKSAGEAVGNAAAKTWNCLTTLFTKC